MILKIMDKEITELANQLGKLLKDLNIMICTAESCTGGGIAQAITEIPGSSIWFDRGFVTYSNNAKVEIVQVKQSTIDKYGAVSEEVAIEMVEGALINSNADLAVSVTGIAGPDGGSKEKPVGTVYIAWKLKGKKVSCSKQMFIGDRAQIREDTIKFVLMLCSKYLT